MRTTQTRFPLPGHGICFMLMLPLRLNCGWAPRWIRYAGLRLHGEASISFLQEQFLQTLPSLSYGATTFLWFSLKGVHSVHSWDCKYLGMKLFTTWVIWGLETFIYLHFLPNVLYRSPHLVDQRVGPPGFQSLLLLPAGSFTLGKLSNFWELLFLLL